MEKNTILRTILIIAILALTAWYILDYGRVQEIPAVQEEVVQDDPHEIDLSKKKSIILDIDEDTSLCPTELEIQYAIRAQDTATVTDDNLYIEVINRENKSFDIEITVEEEVLGKLSMTPFSVNSLPTQTLTTWWRTKEGTEDKEFDVQVDLTQCERKDKLNSLGGSSGASSSESEGFGLTVKNTQGTFLD